MTSTVGTYAYDTVSYRDAHLLESPPVIATPTPDAETFTGLELLPGFTTQPSFQNIIHSPDGSLIAGHSPHGSLIAGKKCPEFSAVWRLVDGKLINQFEGNPEEISPDNRLIVIGRSTNDRFYRDLYDLQTGKQLGSWSSWRAFFLSDGQLAVESGGYTRIFDPTTRKVPQAFPGEYASFSSDEQNVAVLYGRQIHIYRVSDGKFLQKLEGELPITHDAILRFSANGQTLAAYTKQYGCCTAESSFLNIWRVTDGRHLADLSQYASPFFSLSPDGQAITLGLKILRTSDGSLIVDLGADFGRAITNLAFMPNGQQIIVASDKDLYLYPVEGGRFRMPLEADRETYLTLLPDLSPDTSLYGPFAGDPVDIFSGDILAHTEKGIVTILSRSGERQPQLLPVSGVKRFAFSPDGQILALGLENGSVELWDANSQQKIYAISPGTENDRNPVGGLTFSPDGKLLAVGLADGTLRLFGLDGK